MSYMKAFLEEHESMGNKFDYKDYESIPKSIIEIIEDHIDGRYSKVPLSIINQYLNELFTDMSGANEVTNIGVYND